MPNPQEDLDSRPNPDETAQPSGPGWEGLIWDRERRRLAMLWRVILNLVLITILLIPTAAVGFVAASWIGISQFAAASVASLLAIVGGVLVSGFLLDRRPLGEFGLRINRSWWIDLAFGLFLGAFLMTLIFLVEWTLGWLEIRSQASDEASATAFWASIASSLAIFICVGIYEELLTRGYWLKNLSEGLGSLRFLDAKAAIWISVFLTSALFGLGHMANANASLISTFNIFLIGFFLALPMLLTGELAIPIGIHITWNLFQNTVYGFPVSGEDLGESLIVIEQKGPALLTGGAFGPEAGLVGIAAALIGSAMVVKWVQFRQGGARLQLSLAQLPAPRRTLFVREEPGIPS